LSAFSAILVSKVMFLNVWGFPTAITTYNGTHSEVYAYRNVFGRPLQVTVHPLLQGHYPVCLSVCLSVCL